MIQTKEYLKLVQAIKNLMRLTAWQILRNEADCSDAIQAAIFKGWQSREQLRNIEKFNAWLMRILKNECFNIQRDRQKTSEIWRRVDTQSEIAFPYTVAEIMGTMEMLAEDARTLLILYYFKGYAIKEIGHLQGISGELAKSRLHRARQQFKRLYEIDKINRR